MPSWVSIDIELNCTNLTNQNFTNQKLLCISGYKKDACTGEGISDWLVTLNNSSYTTSIRTGSDGKYEFCHLAPGDYTLIEENPSGYVSTTPVRLDVKLPCVGNLTNQNFTNQKLLCISGRKFNDCTGQGLDGWTVIVKNSTGVEVGRNITHGAGYWQVCGLTSGDYTVSEVLQPGWKNVTALEKSVRLGCDNMTGVDFYNTRLLCITGRKTDEVTGQGLAGWEINITDSSGQLINTTATNVTGYYQFCNLPPDTYTVCETLQDGFNPASAVCRSVALDCSNVSGVDFTNTKLLCLQGRKINACTSQGLADWKISYCNANAGCYITTTNETGYFLVCNLTPGIWQVCEEVKDGWRNVTDRCVNIDLNSNDVLNLELRNAPLGCLAGYKENEQGVGLAGWTIEVRNSSGLVGTALTDGAGFWQVCNLEPGEYNVSEVLQGNYIPLTPTAVPGHWWTVVTAATSTSPTPGPAA